MEKTKRRIITRNILLELAICMTIFYVSGKLITWVSLLVLNFAGGSANEPAIAFIFFVSGISCVAYYSRLKHELQQKGERELEKAFDMKSGL